VSNDGPHYPLPYRGPGALGLGKPLKPITHPLRATMPIWLGAEGPRNVALAAEIADGWLAIYYAPRLAGMYDEWLDEGLAKARQNGSTRSRDDFEVAATCQVVVTDDPVAVRAQLKPFVALYIGGMGAPGMNFHAEVFTRMGYGEVVADIGRLFQAGRKDEAAQAVPDELVSEITIVGTAQQVREEVGRWEAAGVTQLLVGCRDVASIKAVAEACQQVKRVLL
jgi:F420-dependent oxidoreductase-like protein